jgi:2-polyprenyl-3-methyl-5-hydroxy-6-metoxy-1,4-benzoquinol methylase
MDEPSPTATPAPAPTGPGPAPAGWHRFTAASPLGDRLPTDVASYGADIPSEPALKLLGNLDGKRVLDLGCGAGHSSVAFAKQGAKVIAIDSSATQVAAARRAAEEAEVRVELHEGDVAELAFLRKDTIDVVFSAYALTEVADLNRVFRQVHRVLKPESPMVFSIPHPAFLMLDPTAPDPLRIQRPYHSATPTRWDRGDESVTDVPRTLADVFVSLTRANFMVDTLLEPAPTGDTHRSAQWAPVMDWVPPTLILRARKQGI